MTITPVTVTLSEPVAHGKETYTTVTFSRKMRGKDMVAMDAVQGGMRRNYAVYASMSGLPLQAFLEMTVEDLASIATAAQPFMGKSSTETDEPAE